MKSALMPRILDDFRSRRAQDDAYYVYPHEQWLERSCLIAVEQAYHTVRSLNPQLHFGLTNNVQREITTWIWADYVPQLGKHATMYTTLTRRLAKLGIHLTAEQTRDSMTHLRMAMSKVPAFVQFAFLKFVCNAWTTSARFNRDVTPCRWCGVYRGDDLRHYTTCMVMLCAMAELRPLLHASWVCYSHPPNMPQASPRAYGLGLAGCEVAEDLLIWVDFMAFMYSSHHGLMPAGDWHTAWNARARVRHRYG